MREIILHKKDINLTDFVRRSALDTDYDELLESDVIAIDADTKKIIFVQKQLDFDDKAIMWALQRIKYQKSDRSRGLVTTSRIFGYSPRITYRKDFCSSTSLANEQPKEHAIVCQYGAQIAQLYEQTTPEAFKAHEELMAKKILDEWAIRDTPFTSGIINKNNPLKYHFDSGNFKNVYSCMAVFKRDIRGGYLSMPEYGVAVNLPHNSVFMFDGQSVLHGVTPITKLNEQALRFSVVYYSLQQIWSCLPLTEELARIRGVKTTRERNRVKVMRGEADPSDTLSFDNGETAKERIKK